MATYAIGDVQGCMSSLELLLRAIEFDPARDRIWLAGDLANRGPRSVDVLRWARDLGERVVAVLGNHDLHLLGAALGLRELRPSDTLAQVLDAPEADELIDWIRTRPLFHRERGFAMMHAGLHPAWSTDDAGEIAREIEAELRADDWRDRFETIYPDRVRRWTPALERGPRLRAALSFLVGVRCVHEDGAPCRHSGPPEDAPAGCVPWFEVREDRDDETLLFGHWALMRHRVGDHWVALDSGCVWGGKLTAYRLEDGHVTQVDAVERRW